MSQRGAIRFEAAAEAISRVFQQSVYPFGRYLRMEIMGEGRLLREEKKPFATCGWASTAATFTQVVFQQMFVWKVRWYFSYVNHPEVMICSCSNQDLFTLSSRRR
jgi:hypothetical protein